MNHLLDLCGMAAALLGLLFMLAVLVGKNLRARRRDVEQLDRRQFVHSLGFRESQP